MPCLRSRRRAKSPIRPAGPSPAAAPHPATTPRYLRAGVDAPERATEAEVLTLQRQEEAAAPASPPLQLTPPGLLQPTDPYARFRPDFGLHYRLDPELQASLRATLLTRLDPVFVLPRLGAAGAGSAAAAPAASTTPPTPAAAAPGTAPGTAPAPAAPPASAPPPAPAAAPAEPRPGTPGDVVGALVAMPQVAALLASVQSDALGRFDSYWSSASTGERAGFVASSVVVGAGMLAPLLGFRESREVVLPLLNDKVIPVPGLPGYGVEFRFGERDVMVGVHLDLGTLLLPESWGFGPASLSPIGAPPGSEPGALPPLSRQDSGEAPGAGAASLGRRIRAAQGSGEPLPDTVRERFEPALGADLAAVRVHADANADALARDAGAHAFTAGRDIFFRRGRYDPAGGGERLLAHELAHTVQQAAGPVDARPFAPGLRLSTPHDRHEREAEALAGRACAGLPPYLAPRRATPAPAAHTIQRQPAPAPAKPKSAAEAARLAPPAWTDYFDEVVPAVLEAAEGNDKVGLPRAMWLIVQAWGEQSPGVVGVPSGNQNRLFNEQAAVEFEPGTQKIKRVLPGQESEGVYLFSLNQNEAAKRGETQMKRSPTFGYDSPERAAHHHLEQMQSRWGPAWNKLTAEKSSFEEFAHALKASGYARAEDYDTKLIEFKQGVEIKVRRWLAYRMPQMREREQAMSAYVDMLRDELHAWQAAGPDPVGANEREAQRIAALLAHHEAELAELRARLARLERFAGVLGMKLGGGAANAPER